MTDEKRIDTLDAILQVDSARVTLKRVAEKHPSREFSIAATKLQEASMWLREQRMNEMDLEDKASD